MIGFSKNIKNHFKYTKQLTMILIPILICFLSMGNLASSSVAMMATDDEILEDSIDYNQLNDSSGGVLKKTIVASRKNNTELKKFLRDGEMVVNETSSAFELNVRRKSSELSFTDVTEIN
jgi:hypothetical protein